MSRKARPADDDEVIIIHAQFTVKFLRTLILDPVKRKAAELTGWNLEQLEEELEKANAL